MHKEFKRLLENAIGVSEHVIAINLDIRGFSSFCKEVQDWDVANYIKIVYQKILDEYLDIASYYKSTGDGLIIIIPCDRGNVKDRVNYVVKTCLKFVETFSSMCDDEYIINFPKPSKIGIGIARGSICRISNTEEDKVLDYSGRVLNLASRLMDMARPSGIVIDQSLGQDLLEDELKERFTNSEVYVRGISEKDTITVYYTKKETSIPSEYKTPLSEPKWKEYKDTMSCKEIRSIKAPRIFFYLAEKPSDDDKLYLDIRIFKSNLGSIVRNCSAKTEAIKIVHRGNKHLVKIDVKWLKSYLDEYEIPDDAEVLFEFNYP